MFSIWLDVHCSLEVEVVNISMGKLFRLMVGFFWTDLLLVEMTHVTMFGGDNV